MKFRAWDKQYKKIVEVDMILFSSKEIDFKGNNGEPKSIEHFNLMQYTGMKDSQDKEIWEGDLRLLNGKIYKVVNDGWRFRFERNMVEFGENRDIILDEDSGYVSSLAGNYYTSKYYKPDETL